MPMLSRVQFLKDFKLSIDSEFTFDGREADWAPAYGGPRIWGQENASIELDSAQAETGNVHHVSSAAVSFDGAYLAVACDNIIHIIDMQTLQRRSRIDCIQSAVHQLAFVGTQSKEAHAFVSYSAEVGGGDGLIHKWTFDKDGCLPHDLLAPPMNVESLTERSMEAIMLELRGEHILAINEINSIRSALRTGLAVADGRNRLRKVMSLEGQLCGFGSNHLSHDRSKLACEINGMSTQEEMRPSKALPQIVILAVDDFSEICRLQGHTDAIMWCGWSPDDKTIATASWDETFRLWDPQTGECLHRIGSTGGQNWSGGFLDSETVLLSGGRGPYPVGIYDVNTGTQKRRLIPPDNIQLDHWMRYFAIHSNRDRIIFAVRGGLLAWRPSLNAHDDGRPEPEVQEIFRFTKEADMLRQSFVSLSNVKWSTDARYLLCKGTDGSTFVWNAERNLKWRFQRPYGHPLSSYGGDVFVVKRDSDDCCIAIDGDGKIRLWTL